MRGSPGTRPSPHPMGRCQARIDLGGLARRARWFTLGGVEEGCINRVVGEVEVEGDGSLSRPDARGRSGILDELVCGCSLCRNNIVHCAHPPLHHRSLSARLGSAPRRVRGYDSRPNAGSLRIDSAVQHACRFSPMRAGEHTTCRPTQIPRRLQAGPSTHSSDPKTTGTNTDTRVIPTNQLSAPPRAASLQPHCQQHLVIPSRQLSTKGGRDGRRRCVEGYAPWTRACS